MTRPDTLAIDDLASPGATPYPASRTDVEGAVLALERGPFGKRLLVAATPDSGLLGRFDGVAAGDAAGVTVLRCPLTAANAAALRRSVPDLAPRPLGLATSAGFGDRLGIATPGHVRALGAAGAGVGLVAPIFAQQSIREMTRTRRSPTEVLSDATWGAFEAGWRGPLGADADHLKTEADVDACVDAGFSFFTIDPGEHVDDGAAGLDHAGLSEKLDALPWEALGTTRADLERAYVGRSVHLDSETLTLTREQVWRAGAKYGAALAHVARLYRHLLARKDGDADAFDFEVSVDETDSPTSPAQHALVALELARLGVAWVSLAPRFPGRFEKGVDYIGDIGELAADLKRHAEIARRLGPYKLSLHSGSDKFTVYGPFTAATGGLAHLKTAGTSYLEALRVIAATSPELFREVLAFARVRYPTDRASYHISARLDRVPADHDLTDADLPGLVGAFDARQVLHVTFGSVLEGFGDAIRAELVAHEEEHYATLEAHFVKHIAPFVAAAAGEGTAATGGFP